MKKGRVIDSQTKLVTAEVSRGCTAHAVHAVGAIQPWLKVWPREKYSSADTSPKLWERQRHNTNQGAAGIPENLLYMTCYCEESLMGTPQKTSGDMFG